MKKNQNNFTTFPSKTNSYSNNQINCSKTSKLTKIYNIFDSLSSNTNQQSTNYLVIKAHSFLIIDKEDKSNKIDQSNNLTKIDNIKNKSSEHQNRFNKEKNIVNLGKMGYEKIGMTKKLYQKKITEYEKEIKYLRNENNNLKLILDCETKGKILKNYFFSKIQKLEKETELLKEEIAAKNKYIYSIETRLKRVVKVNHTKDEELYEKRIKEIEEMNNIILKLSQINDEKDKLINELSTEKEKKISQIERKQNHIYDVEKLVRKLEIELDNAKNEKKILKNKLRKYSNSDYNDVNLNTSENDILIQLLKQSEIEKEKIFDRINLSKNLNNDFPEYQDLQNNYETQIKAQSELIVNLKRELLNEKGKNFHLSEHNNSIINQNSSLINKIKELNTKKGSEYKFSSSVEKSNEKNYVKIDDKIMIGSSTVQTGDTQVSRKVSFVADIGYGDSLAINEKTKIAECDGKVKNFDINYKYEQLKNKYEILVKNIQELIINLQNGSKVKNSIDRICDLVEYKINLDGK